MRALALLVPVILAVVACAGPDATDDAEGTVASSVSRGCSKSRSTILASVSGGRRLAITRGFTWLDDAVPYSQSKAHGGYRTDCSGFVSMCWQTTMPGKTTSTFATSSDFDFLGSYDELLPGDAIDDPGHHMVLFLGWDDAAHAGACVLEQASTASDMQFRVRTAASLKSGGFKPLRPMKFSDADVTPSDPASVGSGAPSTCKARTATEACNAAAINGVQCGSVSDGCGGQLDCDAVEGFGCATTQTCTKHLCVAAPKPTTTPDAGGTDSDIEAQSQGEPGDVSSSDRFSAPELSASGCSAAPRSSTRDEAGVVGLALAVAALVRRRRSRETGN